MVDPAVAAGAAQAVLSRGVGLALKAIIVSAANSLDLPPSAIRVCYGKVDGKWVWSASIIGGERSTSADDPLSAVKALVFELAQ